MPIEYDILLTHTTPLQHIKHSMSSYHYWVHIVEQLCITDLGKAPDIVVLLLSLFWIRLISTLYLEKAFTYIYIVVYIILLLFQNLL